MATGLRGGGGVRIDIARGVDENQCDIKILEMAALYTPYTIRIEQPCS